MVDRLAQAAVHRRGGKETHGRIDVVHAEFAGTGIHVRDAGFHGHAIADFEAFDAWADRDDGTGSLMPQDHRLFDHVFAHTPMRVIVQIGSAHPHGMRGDGELPPPPEPGCPAPHAR